MNESTGKHWGYRFTHVLTRGQTVHSLELDNNLSGLPRQIAHIPVAVKVGNQPITEKMNRKQNQQYSLFNLHPGRGPKHERPTWLSALRRLWAGRIGRRSSWPSQCAPWHSSSRPPQCSFPSPFPGAQSKRFRHRANKLIILHAQLKRPLMQLQIFCSQLFPCFTAEQPRAETITWWIN